MRSNCSRHGKSSGGSELHPLGNEIAGTPDNGCSGFARDRPSATAAQLNNAWENCLRTLETQMPQALQYINNQQFADLNIEETDEEAPQILTVAVIPQAIVNKANRIFFEESSLGFERFAPEDEVEVFLFDAEPIALVR